MSILSILAPILLGEPWSRLKKRNANAVTASNAGVSLLGMNPLFFTSFSACAVPKTEAQRRVSLVSLVVPCGTLSAYGTSYAIALANVRETRERKKRGYRIKRLCNCVLYFRGQREQYLIAWFSATRFRFQTILLGVP